VQVLVGYLVQHGTNAEVPKVADRLLDRLLAAFPALQVGGLGGCVCCGVLAREWGRQD